MIRLPRDISGRMLAQSLQGLGYQVVRQTGSHIICRTEQPTRNTESIPDHKALKVGMLQHILHRVADHQQLDIEQLLDRLRL